MNNFLRAQFRHLANNSIKNKVRQGVGLVCGLVALVAVLSPLGSYAGVGIASAVPTPTFASPGLVCSGNQGTITLNITTCTNGNPDWSANYQLDSSSDGGATWFTPSGVASGSINAASALLVYTTPVLTSVSCYNITYRFRLTGITNNCGPGSAITTPTAVLRVCPQPAPVTGTAQVCVGSTTTLATTSTGGTWSSSAPVTIASVGTSGVVTGIGAGTATISYAFSGGCSSTKIVTVVALPAAITGATSVCAGATGTYSLAAAPFGGTWTSSVTSVGTIDAVTGTFSSIGAGTTVITNTNSGGCTSSLTVTVNALPALVSVTPPGASTYCAGGTGVNIGLSTSESGTNYQLYNGASPVGSPVGGTGSPLSFGLQTAAGTYTVIATRGTCFSNMTGSATITITPLPPSISGAGTVCVGNVTTYTNAATGTWSTSNVTTGTIDPVTGVLTALAAGTDSVIFTETATGCTISRVVTVNASPAPIVGSVAICVGGTLTLTATPAGGNWLSSAPIVAPVGISSGAVFGNSVGTSNITYTLAGGCSTVSVVTVNTSPSAITAPATLCSSNCVNLTSTPMGGSWNVVPPSVATINPSGQLCGSSPGTAIITYSLSGCFVVTSVDILPSPTPIAGPTVVCLGQTITLTNGVGGGTWSSSASGNASVVSTTGVVTGITVGTTATITYSTTGGCYTTYVVSVEPVPAPITGTLFICQGQTTLLSTTSTGGTWSTSDTATASIDAGGVLTGNIAGSSIVSYSFATGCRSTAVVTINPLPAPITGTAQVCVGFTSTLSNASAGGTWMSSVPPIADISTTGVVTGYLPGFVSINYTLPTGCTTSRVFTVNANPLPIDGTPVVCVGSITVLSNASPGGPGTWSSSNPGIADINAVTGVVTGISAGTSVITFTLPTGCLTTIVVTVNPLPASITGFPRTCIGFCTPLSDATSGGVWSSLDVAIATISTSGSLCGVAPGTAIISYTLPTGCARNVIATVDPIPAPPTGVLSICVGGTTTMSHTIPGGTWTSSDTIVAKVFLGTGLVTGYVAGTANITYTTAAGCTAFTTITVNPVPPASTGTLYMCEGNTTNLFNLFPGGSWSSASPSIATVGSSGLVSGIAAGTAVISYTLPSGCGVTSIVTVYPLPAILGSVLVCPGVASSLTGSPTGGLWASSPTGIATIGSLSGSVTGVATGTATVTYTLASTCRSTAIVTVQPLPAPITGPTQVCVGSTITLINFTTGGGTWISANPAVGTINATTGVFTGIGAGVATITFTSTVTGCITTGTVTVNPLPVAVTGPTEVCVGNTITISSATSGGTWVSSGTYATIGSSSGVVTGIAAGVETFTYTLPTGCLTNYSVTVNPLPSAIAGSFAICHTYTSLLTNSTPGGVWSISPVSVATISPTGLVGAVSPTGGTATVTYTLPATGCLTTTIITVNPLPDTITGTLNICLNDTITLHSATAGGTWMSDNVYIAVVGTSSGVVASVSAGTVIISYTLPTGCFTTSVLTINPTPQPITGTLSVCQGYSSTLSNITTGGSWSSSNTAVAFVGTATGVVTGIAPGVAYITYTLPSSCPRVIQFTVNPNPAPISGALSICQGDTTILTSSTPGGTWSSSDPSVAFIFMPTGQMIGISTGTSTISYLLPTGCFTITNVTINPVPTASTIVGAREVCVNNTAFLLNPPFPGGTWTSQFPAIASINPASGVYTGNTAGVTNITYTLPTGCDTFIQVTVNPLPATITGVLSVCEGNTTTLSSATPGGTWSTSVPSIGTINSSTGVFTGINAGVTMVTYKLTATGCETTAFVTVNPLPGPITGITDICQYADTILSSTPGGGAWSGGGFIASVTAITSDFDSARVVGLTVGTTFITYTLPTGCFRSVEFHVHQLPTPIIGPDTVCVGSTITLTSTPVAPAGKWSTSNVTIADIDTLTGVLTGISAGVVNVTYTLDYGCKEVRSVTVHPLPAAIGGPINVCETYTITATNATAGGKWSISDPTIATIDDTSGVITGVTAGSVTITYKLITGCFVTKLINVRPLPVVTVNAPTVICKYASVSLTASGADSYSWSPATGLSATTGAIVVASPTITTTYVVTGSTIYGCRDTAQVRAIIDSMLNDISVTGKDSICRGECTVISASGRAGTYFEWRPSTGLSCTICDTTTACPLNTITYNLLAIDSLGCRDSLFFKVTVMPLPVMRVLPNPAIVCNGSTTQLNVKDTLSNTTRFAWFPNAYISCDTCANPIVSNTFNLVYRVTGITPFGCYDSLKVPVTVLDSAFNSINRDTVICIGDKAQLNAISINPDGARSDFLWTNPIAMSNNMVHNPVVSPSVTTTYQVIITPNVCWPDTLYTTVVVVPYPDVSITPPSATVASGTGVPLTATINNDMIISHYAWTQNGTISCDTCYTTIATPTVNTTYTFTATSVYGCTTIREVNINIQCDNTQVFIPNVFSPNGDGINDRFFISGKGISKISKFLIYNRWGELVYERYNFQANDPAEGWDGQFKGVVLPPDVFMYVIEANCNLGEVFKYKGDISIVR
jgi:gliding motility-associated-like protein